MPQLRALLLAVLLAAAPARDAWAPGLKTGRTQVVIHTPASRYAVRGDRNAPVNILYFAPYRNNATKQVQPLLKKLLAKYRGVVRLQWMSRFRQGSYYRPERYAAVVGHEAFAQGGDRLFWRFHDALCRLPSMYTLSNTVVDQVARKVGVNMLRLQAAVARGAHNRAVQQECDLSTRLGVPSYQSSPVLIIGSERYYISGYTRMQYVEAVLRRQLALLKTYRQQGLSVGQIHARFLAAAKQRYRPWRRYRTAPRYRSTRRRFARRHALPIQGSPAKGKATAWVTVVAFLDFTDYRSYNAWNALQSALTRYAGKIRLVYKALPRRYYSNALGAARAAYAAQAQGKFWPFARILFQNRWRLYPQRLVGYARQAGLDVARFQKDSRLPLMSQHVLRDMRLARRVGITQAPGIFVNGRRMPSRYWNQYAFDQLLKRELQGGLLTRLLGR